jgi:hypothetical protein
MPSVEINVVTLRLPFLKKPSRRVLRRGSRSPRGACLHRGSSSWHSATDHSYRFWPANTNRQRPERSIEKGQGKEVSVGQVGQEEVVRVFLGALTVFCLEEVAPEEVVEA